MTKRFRVVGAGLAAMAAAACDTPTRPAQRHTGDTTIVAEYAGVTETHTVTTADCPMYAATMLPLQSIAWEHGCTAPIDFITLVPGDSVGESGAWVVTSPPGRYSFAVQQTGDIPLRLLSRSIDHSRLSPPGSA